VYLIDAKDPDRLAEAKEALDELLGLEALQRVPFLLLGNKIDHPVSRIEILIHHNSNHATGCRFGGWYVNRH